MFRNAQASPATETPEIAQPKPPTIRKAVVNPKQSSNPQSAKSDNLVVPVQPVLGHQPPPTVLSLSLSLESAADQASDSDSIPAAAPAGAGNPQPQSDTDALSQTPLPPSPVAFSLVLQKAGASDPKPGKLDQQIADRIQGSRPSGLPANPSSNNPSSSNGESPPSDTDSRQSAPEGGKAADLKPELASSIKQDPAATEIPLPTGTPSQGLVNIPTSVPSGSGPTQSVGKATGNTGPVAPMETPAPPTPPSARQIDLTVPNDAGRQVDIRILQRGSDVQVTVRTPDGDLAQSLRHNLPELSATLSRGGLREEAVSTAQSHSAGDGDRGNNSRNNGDRQSSQDPEDRDQPANTRRSKEQASVAFAEIVRNETRVRD